MMYVKLYVGNLIFEADDLDLRALFEMATVGEVVDAHVFYDEKNGHSRGFGAVRVPKENAAAALALNESQYRGRNLIVRPWTESARFTQPRYGRRA
jgi:RNA recognition motif-containing protein